MKNSILLSVVIAIIFLSCNQKPPADFLIKNGTIIDGLGNPSFKADLLIRNGIMELVKSGESIEALQTIDATGLIVSPGFIDVHNHTDEFINKPEHRLNEGYIRQGVTTNVGSPDGQSSPSVIREFIDAYTKNGIGNNIAFYVGHNGIRQEVMKDDQQRPPTEDELNQMKALVREGMEMGAVGLSTGLMYEPGLYSTTEEVIELSKEVAPYHGVYDSHVRNPVGELIKSDQEVIEIATKANIPGKIGHLKAVGLHNKGVIKDIIKMVEKARLDGFNIVSDQYPYDGASTRELSDIIVIPSAMKEAKLIDSLRITGNNDELVISLKSILKNKSKRLQIKETSEQGENGGFAWLKATGYTSIRIISSKNYPEFVGKYLSEIATAKDMDSFDALCDLIINSNGSTFITLGGIDENDVQKLLIQPWNMISSDGYNLDQSKPHSGHPRSTGSFTRVLGHYVRDLQLISLEEAIRKMTSFPADFIGLKSRGRIQDGQPADIVIFNSKTIIDNSTYEQPTLFSSGVIHVFVNGVQVLKNEIMTGNAPGHFLNRKNEGYDK